MMIEWTLYISFFHGDVSGVYYLEHSNNFKHFFCFVNFYKLFKQLVVNKDGKIKQLIM